MKTAPPRLIPFLLIALLSMLLLACSTPGVSTTGSTTETRSYNPGRWTWNDLVSADIEVAKAFYEEVFEWEFIRSGTVTRPYYLIKHDNKAIGGIVEFKDQASNQRSARWVSYMSAASVADSVESAKSLGAKVVIPAKTIRGRGEFALLTDPEGALFGLTRSAYGDPEDALPVVDNFFWHELWANDIKEMERFYSSLADYKTGTLRSRNDFDEVVLYDGETPRAGIIHVDRTDIDSAWLPYVRVDNLGDAIGRAILAKGEIVVAPSPAIRRGKVAVIKDSQGAALGLVEWNESMRGEVQK